jgi:ribosomal protein S18 acetylase RimI-like enzyme
MLDGGWFSFEQDIIARDEEKRIVAACLWWYDAHNRVGEFEPVGCHPGYRRKGLASAIMAESLRQMQSRGAVAAVVYTKNNNHAAIRCYASLGFKAVGTDRDWQKKLTP